MSSTITLHRLTPDAPHSWALWPLLESRVLDGIQVLAPGTAPEPVIGHLRKLWGTTPQLLGAWLGIEHSEEDNGHGQRRAVGHLLAWVDVHWGEPVLLVYQLLADAGRGTPVRGPMLMELEKWREELNGTYAQSGSHVRIKRVKLFTDQPDAYKRWLGQYVEVQSGGTVMMFDLSEMTVPSDPSDVTREA